MSGESAAGSLLARARSAYRTLERLHTELFITKYRSALQREARLQEDAFLATLYLSAFGIDDPSAYHTLPVTGELVQGFHAWHQRQGMDEFPEFGVCC
jgi:hypothetical protein